MEENKTVFNYTLSFISVARWRFIFVTFIATLLAVLRVIEPAIYGRIVDVVVTGLTNNDTVGLLHSITGYLLLWVGLFFFTQIFGTLNQYMMWHANNIVSRHFSANIIRNVLGWSQQRYGKHSSGSILKICDEAWRAIWVVTQTFIDNILPSTVSFITVLILGFVLDWRLTLISMVGLPIALTMGLYAWKKAEPKQAKISEGWSDLSRLLGEMIGNMRAVQDFAQEERQEQLFNKRHDSVTDKQLKLNVFWSIFDGGGNTAIILTRIVVFSAGVYFVSDGSLTLGVLITFLGMLGYLLNPIQYTIANALPSYTRALSQIKQLYVLVSDKNDVAESPQATKLKHVRGSIELQNVTFTYTNQRRATLRNISLAIPAGTSCALIGPSGAGKSTLVKLINRTVDPTRGHVCIDGNDVCDYTLQSLRSNIGVVTQEAYLFQDTILYNVRFAKPSASRKEVIAACKKAQAHAFISRLPKGYDSIVGERGVKLSGGERQRISLARIFLADTPILILDESTSALDSQTEHKLQATLKTAMKGRTTVLIAHRLSTVYLADQIAVIDKGTIADIGTHAELMQKGGLYQRLWKLQSGGYLK
ncbi:hypothetical protein COV06_03075 [Candidatus Uhrbacteria bacterium CG10_big_fil_rev_8_21_14_0_10_50_16]|uniref:ABC transporter ATP-binding protein n=1 Tax=Candidatus Uhrbacteria bacterium CG10_big_fil_rev_8_21_14_0_10_50_16 TaxID=1975039 RepID=A0A2H0RLV2_9BACT|nr:MAG: hypothetical protein COV06_03075 [Candidatus Uhrbacteria bacterium CG10_big_fil_rev_8_21_14_0_10_50_16]